MSPYNPIRSIPGVVVAAGWDEGAYLLQMLPRTTVAFANRVSKKIAEEYLRILKLMVLHHVKAGMGWSPMAEPTKRLHGSHQLLRLTGAYYRALRLEMKKDSSGVINYRIGAFKEDMHIRIDKPTGKLQRIDMERLAFTLEHGRPSNRIFGRGFAPIPPRPHHRPAQEKLYSVIVGKVITEESIKTFGKFWRP